MNYRMKYKKFYNVDFGSELEVHHIDENRDNNDIDNLILLPQKLHNLYHEYIKYANDFDRVGFKNIFFDNSIRQQINIKGIYELFDTMTSWSTLKDDIKLLRARGYLGLLYVSVGEDMDAVINVTE